MQTGFSYPKIVVPRIKPFKQLSKPEAQCYFDWFIGSLTKGVGILEAEVNKLTNWQADYERDSLFVLADWLCQNAYNVEIPIVERKQEITQGKYTAWYADFVMRTDQNLSICTYSQCFDISIYFAETMRKAISELKWTFLTRPKSLVDLHQPVIVSKKHKAVLNPYRIVRVVVSKMIDREIKSDELTRMYNVWHGIFFPQSCGTQD